MLFMSLSLHRTPAFDQALDLLASGGAFTFITGRAGTGKSTLLNHFRQATSLLVPVLAPTGVAALNVQGETIHRFFRFFPGITVEHAKQRALASHDVDIYKEADLLLVDEISMVRADLFDCMDQFLRIVRKTNRPFGGLRVAVIGDLYQLPPVVTSAERSAFSQMYASPYFFSSHVVEELIASREFVMIELDTVYRQADPAFVALLNSVRNRSLTGEDLRRLNTRVSKEITKEAITLTAMNDAADTLNVHRLKEIAAPMKTFSGTFAGAFPPRETPTDASLALKKGARVMCVANDKEGRFVNGSLGRIQGFKALKKEGEKRAKDYVVEVRLDSGSLVKILPHTWTIYRSSYDRSKNSLNQEKMGSFTQLPLRLAWAVTIHKSQGKTFDAVAIDLGRGAFASGQTYVALSRCRSFEGLSLAKPLTLHDVRLERAIEDFFESIR